MSDVHLHGSAAFTDVGEGAGEGRGASDVHLHGSAAFTDVAAAPAARPAPGPPSFSARRGVAGTSGGFPAVAIDGGSSGGKGGEVVTRHLGAGSAGGGATGPMVAPAPVEVGSVNAGDGAAAALVWRAVTAAVPAKGARGVGRR